MTYNEKKTLYESIMNEIAKQVKYALNKSEHINESYQSSIITSFINTAQKLSKNGKQYVVEIYGNISNEYVSFIRGKRGYNSNKFNFKFGDLTDDCFDGQILKGKKAQDYCDSLKRSTEAALVITSWNDDDMVYSKQKDDFVNKVLYAVKFSEKGIEMCKEIREKRNQRQENKQVPTENDIKEEREKRLVNLKCEKRFNEDKKEAEKYGLSIEDYLSIYQISKTFGGIDPQQCANDRMYFRWLKQNNIEIDTKTIRDLLFKSLAFYIKNK